MTDLVKRNRALLEQGERCRAPIGHARTAVLLKQLRETTERVESLDARVAELEGALGKIAAQNWSWGGDPLKGGTEKVYGRWASIARAAIAKARP